MTGQPRMIRVELFSGPLDGHIQFVAETATDVDVRMTDDTQHRYSRAGQTSAQADTCVIFEWSGRH